MEMGIVVVGGVTFVIAVISGTIFLVTHNHDRAKAIDEMQELIQNFAKEKQ